MIQVTKKATIVAASATETDALRVQFERDHFLRVPNFLSRELLEFVQDQIDQGHFYERIHVKIGRNRELCLDANAGIGALLLMMNDMRLFQVIQDLTGCPTIGCFDGRVYRVVPGCGHRDAWHSDLGDHRLVAMSINLSRQPYDGGVLQLRSRVTNDVIAEIPNTDSGDAIIFRLSQDLEHRITDVRGQSEKTAFAGWFKSEPTFTALLGKHAKKAHPEVPLASCDFRGDSLSNFAGFRQN